MLCQRLKQQNGYILAGLLVVSALIPVVFLLLGTFSSNVSKGKHAVASNVTSTTLQVVAEQIIANAQDVDGDGKFEVYAVRGADSLPFLLSSSANDEWNQNVRYCAWDLGNKNTVNTTFTDNNVAPPLADLSFRLISGGPNKVMQTACSDIAAIGDDIVLNIFHRDISASLGAKPVIAVDEGSRTNAIDPWTKLLLHFEGTPGTKNITDSSIWNRGVVYGGNPVLSTAQKKIGNSSIYFDGSSYIAISYSPVAVSSVYNDDLDMGTEDFTIEYWEYRTNGANGRGVLTRTWDYSGYSPFFMGYANGGNLYFYASSTLSSWNVVNALYMGPVTLNQWVHYAIVRKGNTFWAYRNGVVVSGYSNWSSTSLVNFPKVGKNMVVGGILNNSANMFIGYIDELRITKGIARYVPYTNITPPSTELSGNDVFTCPLNGFQSKEQGVCNRQCVDPALKDAVLFVQSPPDIVSNGAQSFPDSSISNHAFGHGGGSFVVSNATAKFGGLSIYCNGTATPIQYVNNPDFDFGADDFTIDYWEYRTDATASRGTFQRQYSSVGYTPYMGGYSYNGNLQFYASSNWSSWDIANQRYMGPVTLNQWIHYAIVRSGNTFYIFRNGVQTDTWTSSLAFPAGTNHFEIGRYYNGSGNYAFVGYIDNFRITKGRALWTSNFTPPTTDYQRAVPCTRN